MSTVASELLAPTRTFPLAALGTESLPPLESTDSPKESEEVDTDIWPARRAKAFFQEPHTQIDAYVPGFIYAGSINALVGAAKVGKSTLTWSMLDCAMRGAEFLGEPCVPSRVLYVSEQSSVTFRAQMSERLPKELSERITSNEHFVLALPEHHKYRDAKGDELAASTWPLRLEVWKKLVANPKVDPEILVLDTFNAYADFQLGGENDNGVIASRLFDLNKLRAIKPSLAILILHHVTKAAEASGSRHLPLSAIRGGSAFAAGVDHIVTLNKTESADGPKARTRHCYCQSRLTDERKFDLIWLPNGGYLEIGVAENKTKLEREKAAVQTALNENPHASVRDLERITGVPKSTIHRHGWHLEPDISDVADPVAEGDFGRVRG
jgi:hypothetical protein